MERNKMLINKTNVPQYAIERVARCIYDDISADYAKPEVQAEFALWLAEREAKKTKAAKTVVLVPITGNKKTSDPTSDLEVGSDVFSLVHRKGLVCIFAFGEK